MRATPCNNTLHQLLDRYRAGAAGSKVGKLNELTRLTYHSTAIEGSSLSWPQTRHLLQTHKLILDRALTDQWRIVDHHQALEQVLAMARQRQPLN